MGNNLRADPSILSLRVESDHSLIDSGVASVGSQAPGW